PRAASPVYAGRRDRSQGRGPEGRRTARCAMGQKQKTPAEGEGLDGTASTRRTAVPPRSPPETGGADGGPSGDRSCRPWGRKSTRRRPCSSSEPPRGER